MNNKIKDLAERIEAENEMFKAMTKAQQRVIIAQDCIDRIQLEQIKPNKGRFFYNLDKFQDYHGHKSIQETLNTCNDLPSCEVCAKGGLFLSVVGRVNQLNFNQINGSNGINSKAHTKLLEFFSVKQLALIEYAFEGEQHIKNDCELNEIFFSDETEKRAYNFYKKFRTRSSDWNGEAKNRLIAICENIIRNKGSFKL